MNTTLVTLMILSSCSTLSLGDAMSSKAAARGWGTTSIIADDSGSTGGWDGAFGYNGPIATPEVLPDGSLAMTAEVAAAREAHLIAVQAAAADPRSADGDNGLYDVYKYGDNRYFYHDHHDQGYNSKTSGAWEVQTPQTPLPNPHAQAAAVVGRSWKE